MSNPFKKTILNALPNKNAVELPNFSAAINAASEIFQDFLEEIIRYSRNQYPQTATDLVEEWATILNTREFLVSNLSRGIRLQSQPASIFNFQAIINIGRIFDKSLTPARVTGMATGFVVGVNRAGDSVGAEEDSVVTAISIAGTDGDTELQKALYFYAPAWVTLEFP